MGFKDKYTSETEKEAGKKQISDDTFALGEVIVELISTLNRLGKR